MKILTIAVNTFREAIRDKILYNLLFFAIAIMFFSLSISNLTLGQRVKIVMDVGLASMSIFGLLIAIFVGIQLVYKEIQRRTIYVLLSRPVPRFHFILGKYLGLGITLTVNILIMSLPLLFILGVHTGYQYNMILLKGIFLILMELMLITAVALFFSTFSTPTLSAMFTLGIYVTGHLSKDLKVYGAVSKVAGIRELTTVVYYILPNLENFNIKTEVTYQLAVSSGYVFLSFLYGVAYIAFLLLAASLIFRKRDFR